MPESSEPGPKHLEILPIVVVARTFPARPSALPDVRDFLRRQLTSAPLSEQDVRALCDRVADVLLDAAGPSGTIQLSLRIFPGSAEVDVLVSPEAVPVAGARTAVPRPVEGTVVRPDESGRAALSPLLSAAPPSFAVWLSGRLREDGITMEAASRKLAVSTKTISRWVSGTTEPRLRDLYRIRDVFGEPPF